MMDMQAAPPPYAEMNNPRPASGNPPVLGQQVPGMTGGLPSQGGLSVLANPMAQQLQSFGRGDDSMLVHMTPNEVNSLQGLAMATGGSLTINPHTGLPEAGWLGKLLPTILGAALAATGVGAPLAAGIVGAGQFARTGSLKKGLMAGLGAFGGAGMAGMAGVGGKLAGGNAFGVLGDKAGMFGANMGLGAAANPVASFINSPEFANQLATKYGGQVAGAGANTAAGVENILKSADMSSLGAGAAAPPVAPPAVAGPMAQVGGGAQFTGGLGSRFGQAVRTGLPGGTPGIISKAAPMMAASGVLQGVSGAMAPSMGTMGPNGMVDNSYQGPYTEQKRTPSFAEDTSEILGSSKERRYFDIGMPEVYNMQGQIVQPGSSTKRGTPILQNYLLPTNKKTPKGSPMYGQRFVPYMGAADVEEEEGYAGGGEVELADGAFVLDARTVSEMGNGSSNAGMEALRRIGGRPINGPGDGVSDSIPARIGRDQPARVARDEVVVPAEAVRKIGKGNPKRGADKLYALMDKAHKARKKAKRGQDTKLRRGLV
jgi:hypothetical protein